MKKIENFFDQTVKNNQRTCDNFRKIVTDQGDDYITGCLLQYPYFNKHYELIAIDLCKQQKLNADPKAIQQINFTGNNTTIFLIIEKGKGTVLDFSKGTVYFVLI